MEIDMLHLDSHLLVCLGLTPALALGNEKECGNTEPSDPIHKHIALHVSSSGMYTRSAGRRLTHEEICCFASCF
jgi:hypothetical protein